jgi:RNA polymerase sigma factor FliA
MSGSAPKDPLTPAEAETKAAKMLPQVMVMARMYARKEGDSRQADEYLSVALVGLGEAIDKFDKSKGVLFSTFARYRVRGALLDYMRSQDRYLNHVSRGERKLLTEVMAKYAERGDNGDSTASLADVVNDLTKKVGWRKNRVRMLEAARREEEKYSGGVPDVDSLAGRITDESGSNLEKGIVARILINEVLDGKGGLTEREKFLLRQRYLEDKTQAEVGKALRVDPSYVSILEKRALEKLRGVVFPEKGTRERPTMER